MPFKELSNLIENIFDLDGIDNEIEFVSNETMQLKDSFERLNNKRR